MTADDRFNDRVRTLIAAAVAGLDPTDRDARIAHCRDRDEHGVRMFPDEHGVLEFRWGGRTLLMVRSEDLAADTPLRTEFVAEVPDTPEDLF